MGARLTPSHSRPRPDGGAGGVQTQHALQQLVGELWGAGKAGETELVRAQAPAEGKGSRAIVY